MCVVESAKPKWAKFSYENVPGFRIEAYKRPYLREYGHRMSQDNLGVLFDDNVARVLEQQGFHWEEKPRSVYRVESLYKALSKYSPDRKVAVDLRHPSVIKGIGFAYACFANRGMEKLSLPKFSPQFVWSVTTNHKGSAGLTAWGQTKAESLTRAYERGLQILIGAKKPEPCIAFKRTQFDDKTRLVWGYPYSMTAIEGLIARPLIDHFKESVTPMAFAMGAVDIGSKLRVASYNNKYAYSIDVSSFDASASKQLIHVAFQILSTWFDLTEVESTSGLSAGEILKIIERYFIHTPIVMPNLQVYKGKCFGVPSGSYFTQMVDSIINTIYAGTISEEFSLNIDKKDFLVLGDDILFWSDRNVALKRIADFATKIFRAEFNYKKCDRRMFFDEIHYLGRDWKSGVPNLDQQGILQRMVYPERYRKYSRDKVKRIKETKMLLMSFAAQYLDAYPIYIQSIKVRDRYTTDDQKIEYEILQGSELSPDWLTGYARYRRKYVDPFMDGGHVPVMLQFWK